MMKALKIIPPRLRVSLTKAPKSSIPSTLALKTFLAEVLTPSMKMVISSGLIPTLTLPHTSLGSSILRSPTFKILPFATPSIMFSKPRNLATSSLLGLEKTSLTSPT
ncbi:106aa long hypothetical protein [Pyrococcus horikoshii OT3]|uniref:Uncharacterized protein n=1 Tax=Pyrococcus horikoshii (strain ATCC 700860 / DSM 12428 / JCM 9974 / NBRC 100139 / OT-3) TaxID=70601 RepID=O57897_PYRHO|nr:106aa long hypothetical protein [Pyrococcus horikoshii OT3]